MVPGEWAADAAHGHHPTPLAAVTQLGGLSEDPCDTGVVTVQLLESSAQRSNL